MRECLNIRTPWGIHLMRCFRRCFPAPWLWSASSQIYLYRGFVLILTFITYICYHMSRKPITVVKTAILNCTQPTLGNDTSSNCTSWINELNGQTQKEADSLLGLLDTSYLMSYAVFMFVSGMVAERVNLRYFLSIGMVTSGLFTILFGLGKHWQIHSLSYYIIIQIFAGIVQTTGWPGVVTVVANWFGKGKKGLIFGIWNSHTSIGNIVGGLLAGYYVDTDWAFSFIVPGLIITVVGVLVWGFLPPHPHDVGLELAEDLSHIPSQGEYSSLSEEYSYIREERLNGEYSQDYIRVRTNSPRDGSRVRRLGTRSSEDGELTPLLQSGASSDISDDNVSVTNSTAEQNKVTSNLDSHEASGPTDTRPINLQNTEPSLRNVLGNRREMTLAIESDGDVSMADDDEQAISFGSALKIPGVLEFSLCLFFAKLVSYTFLYWLPTFIMDTAVHGTRLSTLILFVKTEMHSHIPLYTLIKPLNVITLFKWLLKRKATSEDAAYFATLFDIGGIMGGIMAGIASDYSGKSASVCSIMLIAAIPSLFGYKEFCHNCPLDVTDIDSSCYVGNIALLLIVGLLVNGPYALITTAVSAELGIHPSLRGSAKALATVTSIIDGTGSIGAAVGPFLAGALQGSDSVTNSGYVTGLDKVFYMLMVSDVIALILLTRLVIGDFKRFLEARRMNRHLPSAEALNT